MCHVSALWRGVVVSRRCTNVWLGRVVVYVCQQNREKGKGGGMGTLVPSETWEQETHAPHFLSPLYQHLALCYFCALKASDESLATDKCLYLLVFFFFMGLNSETLSFHPHSFILIFAPFLCLLWDATREVIVSGLHYGSLKMGLGHLKGQCLFLFFKRNTVLLDIRKKAREKRTCLATPHLWLFCKKLLFLPIDSFMSKEREVKFFWKETHLLNSLHSSTSSDLV